MLLYSWISPCDGVMLGRVQSIRIIETAAVSYTTERTNHARLLLQLGHDKAGKIVTHCFSHENMLTEYKKIL